jgi:hypothetical protein
VKESQKKLWKLGFDFAQVFKSRDDSFVYFTIPKIHEEVYITPVNKQYGGILSSISVEDF